MLWNKYMFMVIMILATMEIFASVVEMAIVVQESI